MNDMNVTYPDVVEIRRNEMNENQRHEEHMRQFKLGWTEIQTKCINEHINLHVEYLKEEMEKENANQN